MSFVLPWILVTLIPLTLYYKVQVHKQGDKKRQFSLLYLALFFAIVSLSRPVLENSFTEKKFDAMDYIIALDASFSMQAEDMNPTRYDVAKSAIKELLKKHPIDRFSTFIFTSNALLISPPTTDTKISLIALDTINPKYILTKSTSLKSLLTTVSKTSFNEKKLIVFTDGGDEHNLNSLLQICKQHNIITYIVATASKKGSALKKDGYLIKDQYSSIVISKVNPILKNLAHLTGGKFYELYSSNLDVISDLSNDISNSDSKKESIQIRSYKELFVVPLLLSILFFFFSITKLHQMIVFIPFLFLPQPADAKLFDFYYLNSAKNSTQSKKYLNAARDYKNISPSVESYYNMANSYYKAGHYKQALRYFTLIQTTDIKIKQHIFYNMGNCAIKLNRYDRAKNYYLQALALGKDKDALYNLRLLQKLQLKTGVNLIDMLPPKNEQTKKNSSKSTSKTKDDKKQGGSKKSSNRSAQSSDGAGDAKKGKKIEKPKEKQAKKSKSNYKTSYKSYELINKGYTNEKEPW